MTAGETYRALRVNIAVDLTNTAAFFRMERPRVLLRRRVQDADGEDLARLEFLDR